MTSLSGSLNTIREEMAKDILGEDGVMSLMFEGYKVREEQLKAVPIVWKAFAESEHCLLEGPCGFGKSFAYLIPACMESVERGKKVVIATSGITLQEQLFNKDLPFMREVIKKYTDKDFTFASLKGRQNYLCAAKIAAMEQEYKSTKSIIPDEIKDVIDFSRATKRGDKDEMEYSPDYEVWNKVCSNSNECTGKSCPFQSECFYQKAKAKATVSQVVVVNYHLLLSDIMVEGKVLGPYDILVCDEAHEIADIARDFLCSTISAKSIRDVDKPLTKLAEGFGDLIDVGSVSASLNSVLSKYNMYESDLMLGVQMKKGETLNIDNNNENIIKTEHLFTLLDSMNILKDNSTELFDEANDVTVDLSDEDANKMMNLVGSLDEKIKSMKDTLNNFINHDDDNNVRYLELNNYNKLALKIRMKKVNKYFERNFVNKYFGDKKLSILFTSATLSVNDSFNYIREELGITDEYKVEEYIGRSPFNLTEQELWYLPSNAIDGNKKGFVESTLPIFRDLISKCNGGVLGLFTSVYAMNKAYEYVESNSMLSGIKIYKQGTAPRNILIEQFKNDPNSVLIGTKSLFTGIDVPGDSLRCVFIDKLPFPNLSDPVTKALNMEAGAFHKYSIPSMIISLKQAVGRGVRSVDDKCVIAICDNRMSTARYKSQIFKSFKYDKTGTRNLEDVSKFLY